MYARRNIPNEKFQSCHSNPGFMNSGIRDKNGTFWDLGLKDLTQNQLLWSHQCHEVKPKPKKKLMIKVQNHLKWAVRKILSFVKLKGYGNPAKAL